MTKHTAAGVWVACLERTIRPVEARVPDPIDKDIDRLAEFVPDVIEKNALKSPDADERIRQAVKDAFVEARALADEQWNELQDKLKEFTEEELKALNVAKLFKVYPCHHQVDLTPYCSPKINRYYGNADVVLGGARFLNKRQQSDT